jgi:hypothetical protein
MFRMWSDRPSLGLAFSYTLVPADGFLVILMVLKRGLIDLITELPITKLFSIKERLTILTCILNSVLIIMFLVKSFSLLLQVGV